MFLFLKRKKHIPKVIPAKSEVDGAIIESKLSIPM
jgi:hypothetical protein